MSRHLWLIGCTTFAVVVRLGAIVVAQDAASQDVGYNRDVRPVLSDKCFRCHGPDAAQRKAELRLDRREEAIAARSGAAAIVPEKPSASELMRRIASTDADERMPPADSGAALTADEIGLLRRWIQQGAEYQAHWSFLPPRLPPLPSVRQRDWPRNPMDRFVLAELERHGLQPSAEASRETLLRRVTLDLTGLPPTLDEIDAFLADDSPRAYENVVERLLKSPRYGERMALDWLDAARYADTNGYFTDGERQAWPWRDWVIQSFNANQPFDQFTIEQLAGDLLPQPTLRQRIATGFNRQHMVTDETGVIEEESRVGYVVDRVDTTTTVWLGLTMGCARCHDHKYDPISQHDYYRLFAAFNNVPEAGIVQETAPLSPAPNLSLTTAEQEQRLAKLADQCQRCEGKLKAFRPALDKVLADWEVTALDALPVAPTKGSLVHFDFDRDDRNHGPVAVESRTSGLLAFEAGVKGRGATFDATQYVEFSEPAPLQRDRPFTLSVWIMPGNAPQGCVVSKMDSNIEARGFEILWYKSQPRINLAHDYGRDGIEVVAQQKFSGKQWRQLVITYDGSSRAAGLKVYIDGQLSPVVVRRDSLTGSVASVEPWRIAWKGSGIGFEGSLDELRLFDRALSADEVEALHWHEFLAGTLATPRNERTRPQADKLEAYYLARHGSEEVRQLTEQLRSLHGEEEAARKEVLSVSVMQEMDSPRATRILVRGQYDQPGEPTTFGIPAALGELPPNALPNRLGFAQWLVSPSNLLTARVAVNRLWQQCFGEGLVRTGNDFGLQGEPPSHPELLDWLAARFVEDGWDVQALLKLIVTSATYRQSSQFTQPLLARDPENRWLARGPRYRLSAEIIRDQALAVSGLLVEKQGGPSVRPYQPPGLWEAVSYNGELTYKADHGESLYRRSLYTYWKRQSPPPGILIFDGPTREVCTVRRPRTNTPLQALLLLNDVTFVEAARGLATRMMRDGGADLAARIRHGFRLVTGRWPNADEVTALNRDFESHLTEFRARPESVKTLLQVGESPVDPRLDPCELATWTITASVLLNLDEFVTKH